MGLNLTKLAELAKQIQATAQTQLSPPKTIPINGIMAALAKISAAADQKATEEVTTIELGKQAAAANTFTDRFGKTITYNEKQMKFVELASSGADCILIGAAGTGKTTCMKGTVNALIDNGIAGVLDAKDHKYLISETPGIVVVAFTRRAVNNIRKNMPEDMQQNCITIHKLLEYEPVFYTVWDPVKNKEVNKVEFRPARNEMNPLPPTIHAIAFEEGSMVGTDIHEEVEDAMPHRHQKIYLGDIQQLPPVFGPAILGFKLLELPVVELTEVYRQALESPIIRLAHRILSGKIIHPEELKTMIVPGQLSIAPWSKEILPSAALKVLGSNVVDKNGHMGYFPEAIKQGHYDPVEDMILIPQNVGLGTEELNKYIAQYIAHRDERDVWEIIAGFEKHYFSVGDKVMYERADGVITKIEYNPLYSGGKMVRKPSKTLTYWGMETSKAAKKSDTIESANIGDVDMLLSSVAAVDKEERVNSASHKVTVRLFDSDKEIILDKAAQINNTILGYALTVHKSQGSEWRRVFVVFHKEHNRMLQRELLYTAVTRAKEELVIICERDSFIQGIQSQRIQGNTLAEKAEFFKGKYKKEEMK